MSSTSTSDMMPSQNDGVAMPAIATMRTTWSSQVFSFSAEMVPSGMAIATAITVAITAICSDTGRRVRISCETGLPDHIEMPKSKVAVVPEEVEELQDQRLVQAELQAAGLDRRLVHMRAAGAHADHADVARDQAHQHEDQRGGSDQRGHRQQEPGHDIAIHPSRSRRGGLTCPARCWRGPG